MSPSVLIRGFRPRDPKGIPKSRGQWQEARDIKIASQFTCYIFHDIMFLMHVLNAIIGNIRAFMMKILEAETLCELCVIKLIN